MRHSRQAKANVCLNLTAMGYAQKVFTILQQIYRMPLL